MAGNEELLKFQGSAEHVVRLGLRSKAATIRRLAPDIAHYLELGYSLGQLLDVLLQAGLAPTPLSTFKSVLARWRAGRRTNRADKGNGANQATTLQRPQK